VSDWRRLVLILLLLVVAQVPHSAQRVAPRIRPVESSEWTDVQRELLGARAQNGQVLNAVKTYIRHPELYRNFGAFSRYIEGNASTLAVREKEIIVLRTVWLTRDEYSWAYHVPAGKRAGLTDEEILRITKGADAQGWSAFDAALLQAADELHADQFIKDATWKALAGRYNERAHGSDIHGGTSHDCVHVPQERRR
jgi:alkylhydroperoxidase/carboxymuconolactone decarboxylase family protein YurZ